MIPARKNLLTVLVFVGIFLFPPTALAATDGSTSDISSAVWGYSNRTLSDFGNFISDIWGYSTARIELGAITTKIEKLQELVTAAGSVGTLFGFVGGTQTLAVGGITLTTVAGFVFLAGYGKASRPSAKGKTEQPARPKPTIRLAFPIILVFVSLSSAAASALITGKILSFTTQPASQSVLGTAAEEKPNLVLEEKQPGDDQLAVGGVDIVRVVVPPGSRVNLRSQPDLSASVLTKIEDTREVVRLSESGDWTKVTLEDLKLEGWISTEFIEEGKPDNESVLGSETLRSVLILDTPTGWVRVRETPSGTETGRAYPGDRFTYLGEVKGWVQVELQDGSKGWIFEKYAEVERR
ncbi:MAG: SH3 domain-containing protein [bacterium]|nr:SH3 domain-containing protein [bacterium]